MSVATPPDSLSTRRLAVMSKTRASIGEQKTSKLPAAAWAIEIAMEPRIRTLADRWTSASALTSERGELSSARTSKRREGRRGSGSSRRPARPAPRPPPIPPAGRPQRSGRRRRLSPAPLDPPPCRRPAPRRSERWLRCLRRGSASRCLSARAPPEQERPQPDEEGGPDDALIHE